MLIGLLFLLGATSLLTAADEKKKQIMDQIVNSCKQETYGTTKTSAADRSIQKVVARKEKEDPATYNALAAYAQKLQKNSPTREKKS